MKNTKLHFLRILTYTSLIIVGCEKEDSIITPPEKPSELIPLQIGNQWTFIRTEFDTLGLITKMDTIQYKITEDTLINNQKWFKQSYWQVFYRNDEEGFWEFYSEPKLAYKYPAQEGSKFYNNFGWEVTVISTDTLINTPLGSLHCYQYQLELYGFKTNNFLSPVFGFVYMESAARWYAPYPRLTEPFLFEKWELISADITK